MNPNPDTIAINILGNVMRALGGAPQWEGRLMPAERALVRACCVDAARLGLRALALPGNRELHLDLLRERAAIHARLVAGLRPARNGEDAGAADTMDGRRVTDAFWEGFRRTINHAVAVAFADM
jgi:hypothetical protein